MSAPLKIRLRRISVSAGKALLFLGLWAGAISLSTLAAVQIGGSNFYRSIGWRIAVETGGALGGAIALLIVALMVEKRGASTLGFAPRRGPGDIAAGIVIGAIIFCLPLAILFALGFAHPAPDFVRFSAGSLAAALILVLVNVVDQELLVRSYLFQEIWTEYSGATAVMVTSILFVVLHAGAVSTERAGVIAGLNIALAGVLLGIAYIRSGALWLPIGIHFGWNAVQGPVLGMSVTGTNLGGHWRLLAIDGPALWTGGGMGVEGGLAGLAGPLLGIALVLLMFRRREHSRRTEP